MGTWVRSQGRGRARKSRATARWLLKKCTLCQTLCCSRLVYGCSCSQWRSLALVGRGLAQDRAHCSKGKRDASAPAHQLNHRACHGARRTLELVRVGDLVSLRLCSSDSGRLVRPSVPPVDPPRVLNRSPRVVCGDNRGGGLRLASADKSKAAVEGQVQTGRQGTPRQTSSAGQHDAASMRASVRLNVLPDSGTNYLTACPQASTSQRRRGATHGVPQRGVCRWRGARVRLCALAAQHQDPRPSEEDRG